MDEQEKFEVLVMLMAEIIINGEDDEVYKFEEAIENSGLGKANFNIRDYPDRIDIIPNYKRFNQISAINFYAEYYDGFQAPFTVCEWRGDYLLLENILMNSSKKLYKQYQDALVKSTIDN